MFGVANIGSSVIISDLENDFKVVVPTTAGEQKVIDTWDLTSLDGAWRLLFKLNI